MQKSSIIELQGWQVSQGLDEVFEFSDLEFSDGKVITHIHPKCHCESFDRAWHEFSYAFKSYHQYSFEEYLLEHISFTLGIQQEQLVLRVSPNPKLFNNSQSDCKKYYIGFSWNGSRVYIDPHVGTPLGEGFVSIDKKKIGLAHVSLKEAISETDISKISNILKISAIDYFKFIASSAKIESIHLPEESNGPFHKTFKIDVSGIRKQIVKDEDFWEHLILKITTIAIRDGLLIHFTLFAEYGFGLNSPPHKSEYENLEKNYLQDVLNYERQIVESIKLRIANSR